MFGISSVICWVRRCFLGEDGNISPELGPVGVKIMGFLVNITQIDEWWLLGYGFGSFQRPGQIVSPAIGYDPGIIQLISLSQGFLQGFYFCLFYAGNLVDLKYDSLNIILSLRLGVYLR